MFKTSFEKTDIYLPQSFSYYTKVSVELQEQEAAALLTMPTTSKELSVDCDPFLLRFQRLRPIFLKQALCQSNRETGGGKYANRIVETFRDFIARK